MFNQKNNTYANFGVRALAVIMDIFMITLPINVVVGLIFGFDALKNGNETAGTVQFSLLIIVWGALSLPNITFLCPAFTISSIASLSFGVFIIGLQKL